MHKTLSATLVITLFLSACGPSLKPGTMEKTGSASSLPLFESAPIDMGNVTISPELSAPFSLNDVKNIQEMAKAYEITLSAKDLKRLEKEKFILKRLTDTNIVPKLTDERGREFLGLYNAVAGGDEKSRTQANTLFWSADVFLHSYTLLITELLKEMENTVFAPNMATLSNKFLEAASKKLASAKSDTDKLKWKKIRNYFAIPAAILSTSIPPLSDSSYMDSNGMRLDPELVMKEFKEKDKAADTIEAAKAFIDKLELDSESKKLVLEDLERIYKAEEPGIPSILAPEYKEYAEKTDITFKVDFSQFTPRSHYTSSSLRRQYFRAMNWYIQVPFFLGSDALTTYAFGVSDLLAEHPEELKKYSLLESTINFLVGTSDDLMPVDYLNALRETKGKPDQEKEILQYLQTVKQPKIKSLAALYPTVGEKQSGDVLNATTGMRFFSGKFILDSYWTGYLTQGDEAPRPGYTQKLPPMASSLQVMALLGSEYARSKIPTLDFYNAGNKDAIDQAMNDLTKETSAMTDADWNKNAYSSTLSVIRGLFSFDQENKIQLPQFMQGETWPAKNLQTGAGFWTEARHTVLLYAKQSFAEKGGGGGCDARTVPEPAKVYIEPQPLAYRRLRALAMKLDGLKTLGFTLKNFGPLSSFVSVMDTVIAYTDKELANTKLTETVTEHSDPDIDQPSGKCVWYEITQSDWETLRKGLLRDLDAALPYPVEGPVLTAKDKRAAIVADVHTGGDSLHDTEILYQGTGVPYVILTAVQDSNGPRLSIGFTYSQFEFRKPIGKRMTDEQWQEVFYKGTDDNQPFDYTSSSAWPKLNSWYAPLF